MPWVLNLGYMFKYCFGGEWVGHIGSDSRYLPLDEQGLKALLEIGRASCRERV